MVVLFGLVGLRLVMVQVVGADYWASYGENQRITPIQLVAGRGAIFDRNGYDLAITVQQPTFVADPRLITDPEATAATLAPILGLDAPKQEELRQRLAKDASFVYVARQVPTEVAEKIEAEKLDGIWSIDESKRFNPAGELGRSLLGRVGVDNEGLSALELQYDDNLAGEPGELIVERDLEGRTIPAGRHDLDPATPGDDLELTIDRNLQVATEEVLADAVRDEQAKGGYAIITNPENGEILALANIGLDDAGNPVSSGENVALTANYEPGSVNKVVTLAAALEEGLFEPDSELMVPGRLQVADHAFTDDHHHLTEPMSLTDILTDSSNVGTIMVAQELGKQKLYDYLRDFGFGQKTALDFPQEVAGSLLEPADWSGTSIGTIPIGHGVSVTAMQMLYAYNAIANDGVYVPPKLVDNIIDADGERRPGPEGESHRVVSPTTAAQMRAMLANVVRAGTGEAAAIEGYEVAGKTGTARKPQEGGGYVDADGRTHNVATFAGFMPADDPKLSVIVVLDEPRQVYASSTAAPAFRELSRYALRLMHVPPTGSTGTSPTANVESPLVRGQAADPPPPPPSAPTTALPVSTPPPTTPVPLVNPRARRGG
ncbi:MAG TPA: penicillin-binding protein 2 [Acidimicrobiales bacterium]|nr:penicillin-binding protein 2 [Acidimicrobiales bacterium]